MPYRHDNKETDLILEIKDFIEELRKRTGLTVMPYDESFSSHRALETMLQIGTKKKKRRQKGSADKIAAAIILRDFLQEIEG